MQYQQIFSDKYLRTKLSNYSLADIHNIQEKQQKIVEWQSAIKKGNIKITKERALQTDFLNTFFGEILEYEHNRSGDKWNLEKEFKSVVDGTQADGALGYFSIAGSDARTVIELKDAKTDLDKAQNRVDKRTPVEQAFGYANKAGGKCKWVIVSNFKEIRLYNSTDQSRYELFDILELLNGDNLKKFFFLLHKDRLILETQKSSVDILFEERQAQEQKISKQFYNDYKTVRIELFNHLKQNNPKNPEVLLFTKAQKILDRIIFICFCEDLNLLPEYTFRNIIKNSKSVIDFSDSKLWTQIKNLFKAIDQGYPDASINKFNGGLFAEDKDLDSLIIKDAVIEHLVHLAEYDFNSDLNVNILGHIFEQSISDIEEIKAQIEGQEFDDAKGKRKKDGIFYTPEYITRYIVKEAVGGWLDERKTELGVDKLPILNEKDYDSIKIIKVRDKGTKKNIDKLDFNKNIEKHIKFWEAYRENLSNIKVLDPACGSGAFLNQVFDYLHHEGEIVNNELAKLRKGQRETFDLDKHILTNNIFGVDLNPESVEITKLSLWLKTANRYKELTALDNNIQCGNSLIDNPKVIGERAFKWEERFEKIMSNGGFDVVLGNPPYGILIDKNIEGYYREHFPLTSYKTNLYILFIERMFQLFNDTIIHFIIPKSLLFNSFYSEFRKYLIENSEIGEIFTLTEKVFEDAEVGGSLMIRFTIKKKINLKNEVRLISAETYADFLTGNKIENCLPQEFFLTVPNNEISIVSSDIKSVIEKLHKLKGIGEYYSLKNGLNPGNIKHILISDEKHNKDHKPIIWGKDISKYNIQWSNQYINYDENIGDEVSLDDLKSKQGMNKQDKIDFALRTPGMFEIKKIVIRKTGDSLIACLDKDNYYFDTLVHGIYSSKKDFTEEYLLAILNSKPATLFYRLLHDIKGKVFAKISLDNLSKFPIPNASASEKNTLSEKSAILLVKAKEFQEIKTEFLRFICSKFGIDKPTTKLQNWNEVEFKDFLKELTKNKIKLNAEDEFNLMALFEKRKKIASEIQAAITQTDKEIDQMVYRLYNLSMDEIKIIEGK